MDYVENDHLITVGMLIMLGISSVSSVMWGFLADRVKYGHGLLIYFTLDIAIKAYCSTIDTKTGFYIAIVLLGITYLGYLVFVSPILIDRFGLINACQLFPFKTLAVSLSALIASFLRLLLSSLSNKDFLLILTAFSVISLLIVLPNLRTLNNMKQISQRTRSSIKNEETNNHEQTI